MNKQEAIKLLREMSQESFELAKIHAVYIDSIVEVVNEIDESQKLVVPQFVDDWVDNSRECDYEFCDFFDCNNQSEEVYRWLNCENRRQSELNALALSTLIVHGRDAVIVEKEKLYTVEIPNPNAKHTSIFLQRLSATELLLKEHSNVD